jgi:hypothetical protein
MFGFAIVMLALLVALADAIGSQGRGFITTTPYNNPHSDASGARDEHLQ